MVEAVKAALLEKRAQPEALLNFANLVNGATTAADAVSGSARPPNAPAAQVGMTAMNIGNAYRRLNAVRTGALPAGGASVGTIASTPLGALGVAAQGLAAAQAGWTLGKLVNRIPAGKDSSGSPVNVQGRMEALGDRVGTWIGNKLYRR
jgi:hypothetical protein